MSTWSLRLFPRRNRVRWQALTDEELYLTMKGKTMLHLRRISIALLLGGSVLGAILVGAVTHTFAAGNASNASVITGVAFTGTSDQPGPTVTVTGHARQAPGRGGADLADEVLRLHPDSARLESCRRPQVFEG